MFLVIIIIIIIIIFSRGREGMCVICVAVQLGRVIKETAAAVIYWHLYGVAEQ